METIIKVQNNEETASLDSENKLNKLNNIPNEIIEKIDKVEDIPFKNQESDSPCIKANPIIFNNYFTLQLINLQYKLNSMKSYIDFQN